MKTNEINKGFSLSGVALSGVEVSRMGHPWKSMNSSGWGSTPLTQTISQIF
jgi:hypothetical protein